MSYQTDIDDFIQRSRQNLREIVRETGYEVQDRLVTRTPIDTGRAKSSWNIANKETPDLTVTPRLEGGRVINLADNEPFAVGSNPLTAEQALVSARSSRQNIPFPLNDPILTVSNDLEYITDLEHGRSHQAPAGMMALTFHEWPHILADAVTRAVPTP